MGPKRKVLKSGWEECRFCRIILQSTDVLGHIKSFHSGEESKCDELKSPSYATRSSQSIAGSHGFIKGDIVHGFVREIVNSSAVLGRLSSTDLDDIVLLSVPAMALTNIGIGDTVMVWRNREKFLFQTAWPSNENDQLSISLSNRSLLFLSAKSNDEIHVQRLPPMECVYAIELSLEGRDVKPFYDDPDFFQFVLGSMCNKVFTLGANIVVHYYGQQCEFCVVLANGKKKPESFINTLNDSALEMNCIDVTTNCERLANLSLNDSSISVDNQSVGGLLSVDSEAWPSSSSTPKYQRDELCNCERSKPHLTDNIYYVNLNTKLTIKRSGFTALGNEVIHTKQINFDDIGGLDRQINEIRQLLFPSENGSKIFSSYGIQPLKGILLFGPSGTGKTLVAHAIANTGTMNFIRINGPELYSKFYGETEKRIQDLFEQAKRKAPSVVFIDEIDTLCAKRDSLLSQQDQRVVTALLLQMDNLSANIEDRVIVLAATNKPDSLDSAMRRPGRLDREIEFGIPTISDREDILRKLLKNVTHTITDADINHIARNAHGFVGADLAALCAQAGLNYLRTFEQYKSDLKTENAVFSEGISYADMLHATQYVKPSGLRELQIEVPQVFWDDVGGQEEVKHKLKQMVDWPLTHPEAFTRLGITPPKGILMYGPPGCSKTLIAKALATESGLNFIAIKGPELFRKWVGESERAIREVFRKARAASPCIVFIDEIDSLAAERGSSSGGSNVGDRVLAQLLLEMDGLEKLQGVVIIASTNRPDMIDKALLRPGRLDHILYIPLPDDSTRKEIFKIQSKRIPFSTQVDIDYLVNKTNGYSGAEVVAVCREAAVYSLEESLNATLVTPNHLDYALQIVKPRISEDLIKFYENYSVQSK